jgi:secreted trypsin-like serine protease
LPEEDPMKKFASIAAVVVAISSLTACTAEPVEPSGTSSSKIIGGADAPGHPSVGLVRSVVSVAIDGTPMSVGGCTATLIAPSVMVTAAHCAGAHLWTEVSFDQAPSIFAPHGAEGWTSATMMVHPAYDGDTSHGHDIAVVLLVGQAGRPVSPLGGMPGVGATVTAVGYGMGVFGHDGTASNVRRSIDIPLLSVGVHEVIAGTEGRSTCHGDSGGPIFANGALVGTTSYGDDVDCHGSAHFMRIDDNVDFLRRFVPSL